MSDGPLPLFQVLVEEYLKQEQLRLRRKTGGRGASAREQAAPEKGPQVPAYPVQEFEDRLIAYGQLRDDDERKRFNSREVAGFYRWLHTNGVERSALCFSGGGIRSATFGLGVLQGLAAGEWLEKFDYLSTVSGGGYLGGWLSAWLHRKGLSKVQESLKNPPPPPSPLQPEPEAVTHLRAYSRYMSPRLGLLSADTWTLVAIFCRNLILNWLVLLPLILIVLMIPRIYMAAVRHAAGVPLRMTAFWLAVVSGVVAIAYIYANRPSLADAKLTYASHPGSRFPNFLKSQGWFIWLCAVPMLLLAVLVTTFYAWLHTSIEKLPLRLWNVFPQDQWGLILAFACFGIMLHLSGWLLSFLFGLRKFIPGDPLVAVVAGGLGGVLTWVLADNLFPDTTFEAADAAQLGYYVCFATPLFLLLFLLAVTIFVGLASRITSDADREWLARFGAWLIIASVTWSVISALVIFGPVLLVHTWKTYVPTLTLGAVSGALTLVLGRSARTSHQQKAEESGGSSSGLILTLAGPIFLAFILICLSLLSSWLIAMPAPLFRHEGGAGFDPYSAGGLLDILHRSPTGLLLALTLIFAALGLAASVFININKFSLHAAYRDRLIRAYLGASRNERERRPNPFTGLDEKDNIQMQELRTQLLRTGSVLDWQELIDALRHHREPVSQYLWEHLSDGTRRRISLHRSEQAVPDYTLQNWLVNDLNRIIQGDSIYEKGRFAAVTLTPEIREILDQEPLVENRRLNRLLLEQAFAGIFEPAQICSPMHIVNMTLNLVGGKNLAWQNRKAESFTVSALHAGSYCIGYRNSHQYAVNQNNRAISLGTCVAISGAAVSPNMGYYSSPVVTFLLTLFNVRLGWWLGSTGWAGSSRWGWRNLDSYKRSGPALAARPIIAEALGQTDDRHPYVYLSDGGHFENFGLYEMVLRRCQFIVVSDGSADPDYSYEGLGNAISKIRVDMGVPISFENYRILPHDDSGRSAGGGSDAPLNEHSYCAIARIGYSQVDVLDDGSKAPDGLLIYIKASLSGTEPIDIYNYARAHKSFPHESTANQMYSESQFESYRMLGLHTLEQMITPATQAPGAPPVPGSEFEGASWQYPLARFVYDVWAGPLKRQPDWVQDWLAQRIIKPKT